MKDSFTQVFPAYKHEKITCYRKCASHILHPIIEKNFEGKPAYDISGNKYNHRMDEVKEYSESMYKLGNFAP